MNATVFEWPVRVYWEDTDAGGIVFYANYLKFFERARTEWLRALGLGQQQLRDQHGGMFVVTEAQARYLRPARLDDQLAVTACVTDFGRASMTLQQQAWLLPSTLSAMAGTNPLPADSAQRTLLCEGTVRIGWVSAADLRPQRVPADISRILGSDR